MAFGGSSAANLYVRIGADLSEFQKGMQEVGQSLQDTGKRMGETGKSMTKNITAPIMAVGAGILALGVKTGNFADQLLDLSATTGISTDKLQQYRKAEVAAGVATDSIAESINRMNRQMSEGGEYATRLSGTANALGVTLTDTNGKVRDASDVHHDLMLALADIEDPQERARLGAQAFGRDWANVAPIVDLGREAIENMYETDVISREQLEAANNFRAEMDALKHELGMAFMELGTKLAPMLQDVFLPLIRDHIIPAIEGFINMVANLVEWFTNLSPTTQKIILGFIALVAAIGPVLVVVGKVIAIFGVLTTTVLPAAGVALAAILSPVGLVVAAVVAMGIIWAKWGDDIKRVVGDAWNAIKTGFNNMKQSATDAVRDTVDGVIQRYKDMVSNIRNIMSGVVEAITAPFRRAQERVSEITSNIRNSMNNLNPFQRQSPSLVDNVKMGVAEIEKAYKGIDVGLDTPASEMAIGQPQLQGGGFIETALQPGQLAMIIADNRVLKQLQRQLKGVEFSEAARGAGI